jgi:DNA-binding XRE family transcriptional regulator
MSNRVIEERPATPASGDRAGLVHPFEPPFGQLGAGPEELQSAGLIGETVPQGGFLELMLLMARLKARREALGLSLDDVAERSGLDRRAVGELEAGFDTNPTIATLWRYALAMNAGVTLGVEEINPESGETVEPS